MFSSIAIQFKTPREDPLFYNTFLYLIKNKGMDNMILIKPVLIGKRALKHDELVRDRSRCLKIGPCGIGEQALYLNSFFVDRRYYVCYEDIDRVWKRVAMSKGGFSGKGVFGSMAYAVVQFKDGRDIQCRFKYEHNVDLLLDEITKRHADIPIHSRAAERKLLEAEREEKKRYRTHLSEKAEKSIADLRKYKAKIQKRPVLYETMALAAKQKRDIDRISPTYKVAALVIFLLALGATGFGIYAWIQRQGIALYFVLFGIAFLFMIMAAGVLPTGRRNKRTVAQEYLSAREDCQNYTETIDGFPIPGYYAHPIVLERMIRVIRMGRCDTIEDAFAIMKKDLKALNSNVTVSQKEYEEVVAIKPLFLVTDYE